MSEINKIIKKYKSTIDDFGDQEWYTDDVKRAMKDYAEIYAMKVLEVAAENATFKIIQDDRDLMSGGYQTIDKDSILNIKLPEHD